MIQTDSPEKNRLHGRVVINASLTTILTWCMCIILCVHWLHHAMPRTKGERKPANSATHQPPHNSQHYCDASLTCYSTQVLLAIIIIDENDDDEKVYAVSESIN